MFLQSHLLTTSHANHRPPKPKICLQMPPGTPKEGPRKAQDSPRWAQDGPNKVPKIPLEALTPPPWI